MPALTTNDKYKIIQLNNEKSYYHKDFQITLYILSHYIMNISPKFIYRPSNS